MNLGRRFISSALVAVAAAWVLFGTIYFASLRSGYSHISNTISELGETGAPEARLVAYGFFLPVGLIVWLALWLAHRHRAGRDTSLVLLALSGLGAGYVLGAFFPCDPGGPLIGSWRTLVHNAAGLIDYGGTALGFLLFCRYCSRHKMRPQAVAFGIAAALGFLGMVLLGLPRAFPVRGAVQRVTELTQFTGAFFVCHLLSTRAAPSKRPALDAGTDAGLQFGHQPPGASGTLSNTVERESQFQASHQMTSLMSQLMRFPSAVQRDPDIEAWMREHDDELGAIAKRWFGVMRACGDDVRELLHDGHPTACVGDAAFAYANAFKAHVNVGFFRGAELGDPDGLLEGTGKFMRHVKLRPEQQVDDVALKRLIQAAYVDMKQRLKAEQG